MHTTLTTDGRASIFQFLTNHTWLLVAIVFIPHLAGCTDDYYPDNKEDISHGTGNSWTLNSLDDISSYQKKPISNEVRLLMVKGEYEHFQAVLSFEEDGPFSVNRNGAENGLEFSCRMITTFENHEDVLVPHNGTMNTSDKLAKLWITYHTTSQTNPGQYQEELSFDNNKQQFSIVVTIDVQDFILPEMPSITSAFGIYTTNLMPKDTTEAELEKKYKEMTDLLLNYRITPFSNLWPAKSSPYGWNDPRTDSYLSGTRFSRIALPYLDQKKDLESMINNVAQDGLLEKSYFYISDEPSLNAYNRIKAYAESIHQIAPNAKTMVTFNSGPVSLNSFDDIFDIFDYLRGTVQIFCIGDWVLHVSEENSKRFREYLQPGEEFWMYTCMGLRPGLAFNSPAMENRSILWRNWKEQTSGFLFWSVNAFGSVKPLASDVTLPAGDGVLVYPGEPFNAKAPVVSMRLERFRDGAEDYELLVALEKKKGREATEFLLEKVYKGPMEYTNDPGAVDAFKAKLIQGIIE